MTDDDWEERKEISARRKQAGVEAGRRKAGIAGAAMAGIMLTLHEIYEGPLPEEITIVADADGDPGDLDAEGMHFSIGENDVESPPIASGDAGTNDSLHRD